MAGIRPRVFQHGTHHRPLFLLVAIFLSCLASLLSGNSFARQRNATAQHHAISQERQSERDGRVDRLEILPHNVTIRLGQQIHFTTIAYDKKNVPVGGVKVVWRARDARGQPYPIASTGEFLAQSSGAFTVSVEATGHRAEMTIKVASGELPSFEQQPTNTINVDSRRAIQSMQPDGAIATAHDEAEPNWDESNIATAYAPEQRRGSNSLAVRRNSIQKNDSVASGNFQVIVPVVDLPGRGLDLNLNLYYNSRLWHETPARRPSDKASLNFNFEQDLLPGWSFGFTKLGRVLIGSGREPLQSLLIDADGSRHSYRGKTERLSDGSIRFEGHTSDGTLIDYWHVTDREQQLLRGQARYPNGSTIDFTQRDFYGRHLLPTRIADVNGNFITITYVDNFGYPPVINTITDTLGRVIQYHYESKANSFPLLTAITGPGLNGSSRTLIRLHYTQRALAYSFPRNKTPIVHQREPIDVVDAIYYPDTNTGYWFGDPDSYSSYGMLTKVSERRGMTFDGAALTVQGTMTPGLMTRERIYHYAIGPGNSSDGVPTYTVVTERWEGMDTHPALTKYDFRMTAESRIMETTYPDGTRVVRHSHNKPGDFNNGIVYEEDRYDAGGKLLSKSTETWEQGDYDSPRLTESKLTDERNQTTRIEYGYGPYNQIQELREYDYGGALLRRTHFEYLNNHLYFGWRHIFNLPAVVEVFDANGTVPLSRTDYVYDEHPLIDTPGVVQNAQSDVPVGLPRQVSQVRGNITQVTSYGNAANRTGAITESRRYDIAGNLVSTSRSSGEETRFTYSASTQYAYPETVTRGAVDPNSTARISVRANHDFNTGLPLTVTDANELTVETAYEPQSLRIERIRRISSEGPDYEDNYAYNDAALTDTQTILSNGRIAAQTITRRNGLGFPQRLEVLDSGRCVQINEPSDPHAWSDNYLCSEKDYGLQWSYARPLAGKTCVQVNEPSDPDAWSDNYLCSEKDYGLQWSYAGPLAGKTCVQVNEPSDPDAWSDNYLCSDKDYGLRWSYSGLIRGTNGTHWNIVASKYDVLGRLWQQSRPFRDGIEWSYAGPVAGKTCVPINEPSDRHEWRDNYLCSEKDYGLQWSYAGPLAGKNCVQINEPSDPDAWSDNYLCSEKDYGLQWSYSGPIAGKTCVRINEPSDPHEWSDNYLCMEKEHGEAVQWGEIRYDALARPIQVSLPDGSTTRYVYNEALSSSPGQTVRSIDTWEREQWSRTDALGRLAEARMGDSVATYEYNALDQLVRVSQGQQERRFQYDALGRLTHQYLAEKERTLNAAGTYVGSATGGEWSDVFTYDERSNLKTYTDARGVKTIYDYASDPLDRLHTVTYDTSGFADTANPILPAAPVTYDYMTTGDVTRPLRTTVQGINTEDYAYNPKGLLSSKTLKLAAVPSNPFVTEYTYDSFDRLTDIRYPATYGEDRDPRRNLHREFGLSGKISKVDVDGNTHASDIAYDAAGQITGLNVGSGSAHPIAESYEFDDLTGLLSRQRVQRAGQSLLDLSYDYLRRPCSPPCAGRTGQLTGLTNHLSGKSYEYDYDLMGRLVKAKGNDPTPKGQLPQPYSPPYWKQTYSYDQYGNRKGVSATHFSGGNYTCLPAPQPCEPPEQPAPAGMRDGLDGLTYDERTNRITNSGFAYDAAGDVVRSPRASGASFDYQYDAAGRLAKVCDESGAELVGYTYGVDRKRLISEYSEPVKYRTYYVWDGDAVIADYRSLAQSSAQPIAWHQYVFLGDRLLATLRPIKKQVQVTTTELGSIGDVETNQDDFRIGGREERPKQNFHGVIDGVWVFNGALSSEEIEGFVKPQAKLVANWQFEDGSGKKVTDKSGNDNHGKLRRGAEFCAEGVSGTGAVCLDGENDYVQIGDVPSLKMKDALTISAWIYPKGPGNGRKGQGGIIVNKEGEYQVARFADGSIRCAFASDTSPSRWPWMNTGIVAPQGRWTHVTIVYDRGKITAYQDKRETQVLYWHPDRLGTRLVTNRADTNVIEQATFPFGVELDAETSPGAKDIRRRFTSYDRDLNGSKLDYAVNRFYDSEQGRFTQVDPLEMGAASLTHPQSLNLYAYVRNDPANSTDPAGMGDVVCMFIADYHQYVCTKDNDVFTTDKPSSFGDFVELPPADFGEVITVTGVQPGRVGAMASPKPTGNRGDGGGGSKKPPPTREGKKKTEEELHKIKQQRNCDWVRRAKASAELPIQEQARFLWNRLTDPGLWNQLAVPAAKTALITAGITEGAVTLAGPPYETNKIKQYGKGPLTITVSMGTYLLMVNDLIPECDLEKM